MAEAWPATATTDALNGTSDAATGLDYIPNGTSPADTPTLMQRINRLLNRLYLIVRPAAQGRIGQSDAGALKIIVYGIDYTLGGAHKSFATADSNTVADATTNYVYLNSSNALVINNTGFPADITTFYRLGTVVTAAGAITAINDQRGFNDHIVPQTTSSSDTGTDNTTFIIDADNAGAAAANLQVRFNRGSSNAEDAVVEWKESTGTIRARSQHSTDTLCPVDASKYQVAGTDVLTSSGAAKVQSAVAGSGLTHTTGVLSVTTASANGTSISGGVVTVDPSDGIKIDANGVAVAITSNGGLHLTGTSGSQTLDVLTDAATTELDGSGNIRLKDGGTNAVKYANNDGVNGSGYVVFTAAVVNGNTITIHNANAPYKIGRASCRERVYVLV